jgi:3',5'-cyclic AMP phosphodiesterase CpdA
MQFFTGDLVVAGTSEPVYAQWLDGTWKDPSNPGKFVTLGQQLIVMVPGNHEASSPQFYGNFALPGSGDFAESFGSFDLGPVHFAFFDDERLAWDTQSDGAKAVLEFLKADLARANAKRATVPFLVLAMHRGPFATSKHMGESDVVRVRDAIVPIADTAKVDLVLSGHDHEYERSKPVTGPAANPTVQMPGQGTVYVVCAGSGADPYNLGGGMVPYREKNVAFGGVTPYVGTYMLIDVSGTTLDVKAYGMKASASNPMGDDVIDTFTLTH